MLIFQHCYIVDNHQHLARACLRHAIHLHAVVVHLIVTSLAQRHQIVRVVFMHSPDKPVLIGPRLVLDMVHFFCALVAHGTHVHKHL